MKFLELNILYGGISHLSDCHSWSVAVCQTPWEARREARMPMSPQSDRATLAGSLIQESALGAEEIHREVALQLVWRQLKLLEE